MSRQSSAPRNLTLTEELEKLEQSITLTLQEIDSNFSRAHRIVTSSILPIVQQYAQHSTAVWDGSRFWKEFFEASANVSLSGYEEADPDTDAFPAADNTELDTTLSTDASTPVTRTTATRDDSSFLDSSIQTPPPQRTPQLHAPTTPTTAIPSPTRPSPFASARPTTRPGPDPLLHRILDKTYRIGTTPRTARTTKTNIIPSSPFSPAPPAPQLRAEIFGSARAPRTPGISVQKRRTSGNSTRKTLFPASGTTAKTQERTRHDWSDSDSDADMLSPPKTLQFHVPQSRVLQTPARVASKKIVDDLLLTAGAESTVDDDFGFDLDVDLDLQDKGWEDSPSVVRGRGVGEDDDF